MDVTFSGLLAAGASVDSMVVHLQRPVGSNKFAGSSFVSLFGGNYLAFRVSPSDADQSISIQWLDTLSGGSDDGGVLYPAYYDSDAGIVVPSSSQNAAKPPTANGDAFYVSGDATYYATISAQQFDPWRIDNAWLPALSGVAMGFSLDTLFVIYKHFFMAVKAVPLAVSE